MAVLELIHQMDVEVLMANDNIVEQECIPVGCVPPAAVAVGGGGVGWWSPPDTPPGPCTPLGADPSSATMHHPPRTMHPQDHAPPRTMHPPRTTPKDHAPPRADPLGPCTPQEQTPPGSRHPPVNPVNRILDTRLWKYYLAPNFVCGR